MPIRLHHQPAGTAVGLSAYAAGLGRARERQRKYALELLAQSGGRSPSSRSKYGYGSSSRRAGAGQLNPLEWAEMPQMIDPAAQAAAQARATAEMYGSGDVGQIADARRTRQIQAQQRANARAARMGKVIPYPNAMPRMSAGVTRDEANAERLVQQRRRFELEDAERRRAEDIEDQEIRFRRAEVDEYIPPIPEHLKGTEWERDLRRINEAERELRSKRNFDQNDEETQRRIAEIRQEREEKLAEAGPAPDPAEELNKRFRVWDAGVGGLVEPAPGETPQFIVGKDGMSLEPFQTPEQAAEKERTEAEATQRSDREKDLREYRRKLVDDYLAANYGGDKPNTPMANAIKEMIEQIDRALTGLGGSGKPASSDSMWDPSTATAGGADAPVMPAAGRRATTPMPGAAAPPTTPVSTGGGPKPASTSNNYRWDGSKWVKVP